MDQHRWVVTRSALLLVLIISSMLVSTFGDVAGDRKPEVGEEDEELNKPSTVKLMKTTYSLYTSSLLSPKSYWDKLKTFSNQAQAYFFPPNLDFRRSGDANEAEASTGGEKVKEAIAKSVEKTKETVEESAKTAAEIAGRTVQKTKDTVKKTVSHEL